MTDTPTIPINPGQDVSGRAAIKIKPLLIGVETVMQLLNVSRTTLYGLMASGRMPESIRLSRRPQWRMEELHEWIKAGCPSRDRWETMKGGRR